MRSQFPRILVIGAVSLALSACGGGGGGGHEAPPGPTAITIVSSPVGRIYEGDTVQLVATARDAAGNILPGKSATWSSGNPYPGNPCWYNSVTYAVSTDGARSFSKPGAPAHTVAPAPYAWAPPGPGVPVEGFVEGYFNPSNIVQGKDGYYYAFLMAIPTVNWYQMQGLCVFRTRTLGDPASWRAWDGSGFNLRMTSPYVNGRPTCGIFYALPADLVHWSGHRLLVEASMPWCAADPSSPSLLEPVNVLYPSIVDHAETSVNFERAGRTPYLYYVRFNDGGLDRDLVRVPLTLTRTN